MSALVICLPGVPISANHRTRPNGRGGQVLTPTAAEWMADTALLVRNAAALAGWLLAPKTPFVLTVLLTHPKVYTFDCDNTLKALSDAVCRTLGLDDRYIVQIHVGKQRGPEASTSVRVEAAL